MSAINHRYNRVLAVESVLKNLSFSFNGLVISLRRAAGNIETGSGSVYETIELIETMVEIIDDSTIEVSALSRDLAVRLEGIKQQTQQEDSNESHRALELKQLLTLAFDASDTAREVEKVVTASEQLVSTIQQQLIRHTG